MNGWPLRRRHVLIGALAAPAIARAAVPMRVGGAAGLCNLLRRHWSGLFPGLDQPLFDGTSDGVTLAKLSQSKAGGLSLILIDAARLIPGGYAHLLATLDPALPFVAADLRRVDFAHPWLGTVWSRRACDGAAAACGADPALAAWREGGGRRLILPPFTAVTAPYLRWQAFRSLPGREVAPPPVTPADIATAQGVIDGLRRTAWVDVAPAAALQSVLQHQGVVAAGVSSALVLPLLDAGEPLGFVPCADAPDRMAAPLSAAIPLTAEQPDAAKAIIAALAAPVIRAKLAIALHRSGRRASIEDPDARPGQLSLAAWSRDACFSR